VTYELPDRSDEDFVDELAMYESLGYDINDELFLSSYLEFFEIEFVSWNVDDLSVVNCYDIDFAPADLGIYHLIIGLCCCVAWFAMFWIIRKGVKRI